MNYKNSRVGRRFVSAPLCALALLFVVACESTPLPGSDDAGPRRDAAGVCAADIECSDGLFCNGIERCAPALSEAASGCVEGPRPCLPSQTCDESRALCVSDCGVEPDADGDGHAAPECGGDDCDDADANRYPGNVEVCDAEGHDEDCMPLTLGGEADDRDGDGFMPVGCCFRTRAGELFCGADCDDDAFGRSPGAIEVCNGIDDDCNGVLDHPAEDNDGDGHADDACAGAGGSDCDDSDPFTYVGATELCNGRDDDCMIDGARRRAGEPGEELAEDFDGDGHAPLDASCSGDAPAGAIAFARDDCDDRRADVFTGAVERCDGIDNDCDGVIDDVDDATEGGACIPVEVAAGIRHTCVRMPDSSVICWGANDFGQLGDASVADGGSVLVRGLEDPVQLSAGADHSCARERDGRVVCWGSRAMLGATSTGTRVGGLGEVPRVSGATQIASGPRHACALLDTGRVVCWGDPSQGRIDGVSSGVISVLATEVPGLENAISIDAGTVHNCAVRATGGVYCWGPNYAGHLGVAAAVDGRADVPGISDAAQVALGFVHSCALHATGTVSCWGGNDVQQLGGSGAAGPAPTLVAGVSGVSSLVANASFGGGHTCGLRADGSVVCWGDDTAGQLGRGSATDLGRAPGAALLGGPARSLSTGGLHSCAVMDDALRCWGEGGDHQLGSGRTRDELAPREPSAYSGATTMATWLSYSCFVLPSRELRCTGNSSGGAPYLEPSSLVPSRRFAPERFRHTSLGYRFACHTHEDGTVRCDGTNTEGQRGVGSFAAEPAGAPVVGIANAIEVAAGFEHACALRADRTMWCWGNNDLAQLGSPTGGSSASPVQVPGLDAVAAIAVGAEHSCALQTNGAVYCWGQSAHGQAGAPAGSVSRARLIALPDRAVALSAREATTCAVTSAGAVLCWGDLFEGNALPTSWSEEPTRVSGLLAAREVAVGTRHACARLQSGRVLCWGLNDYGQLGNGTMTSSISPVVVSGLPDARDISCAYRGCCATRISGQSVCWGQTAGALGIEAASTVPAPVIMLGE